jgi:hypothetical protein
MEQKIDIAALREALAGLDGLTLRAEGCEVDVLSDGDGIDSVCFALVGKLPAEDVAFCTALAAAANALPALLDEIEALRALTTPEVIGEKHREGGPWQVWEPFYERWVHAKWLKQQERWIRLDGTSVIGIPTHALPMPPEPHD